MVDPIVETPDAISEPIEDVAPTPSVEGESESAETPAETPTPTPEPTEEQRRHASAQKRINQVIREKHDLQRRLDVLQQQVQEKAPASTPADAKPRPEQYGTTEEYIEAVAEYTAGKVFQRTTQQHDQQVAQRAVTEELQATITRFEPLVEAARTKYEDFDEVTSAPVYSPQTQQLIYASPQGADVAYHLALNPELADKINRMSVVAAAREIVKLEAKFAPPIPRTVSKSPTPIRPVVGGGATPETDPSKMSIDEWMTTRKKQLG